MPETGTEAPVSGPFISLKLVARAAGISIGEMRRIAGEVAAGRRSEWLGAAVEVRTDVRVGRRHRTVAMASLPRVLLTELESDRLRFLVAAEQAEPGADLGHADFMLLHRAAQCEVIPPDIFARLISNLGNDGGLHRASRARFDLMMDYLFGFGFRDPALPEVSPDYLAWLDEARRQCAIDDAAFAAMIGRIGGADRPARLTGRGFYAMLAHLHRDHGMRLPLPPRFHVIQFVIGQLHLGAFRLNIPYDHYSDVVTTIGGGCLRARDLDERGVTRVMSHYYSRGFRAPEPPPRVAGRLGFITQPQANLIWKLWHDYRSNNDDVSETALAACLSGQLGLEGGLHGLTAAGVRRVLDYMLEPLIALRLKAVSMLEALAPTAD